MKKILLAVSILGFTVVSNSNAAELAAIMGKPDTRLPVVGAIVEKSEMFGNLARYETEMTTSWFSLLPRREVRSVYSAAIFEEAGSATKEALVAAINASVLEAPVVLSIARTAVGENGAICRVMTSYPQIAFVIPAGAEGTGAAIDPAREPECLFSNILIAATLDQRNGVLASFSNYGVGVRIAAAGVQVPALTSHGGQRYVTGTSTSATITAAHLAVFGRSRPDLRGGALIDRFLLERTHYLPSLAGKVDAGRALNDLGY